MSFICSLFALGGFFLIAVPVEDLLALFLGGELSSTRSIVFTAVPALVLTVFRVQGLIDRQTIIQ